MAKPRIFLSSTCYDLSTIRSELTRFLEARGFEVINSENKNFGVSPGIHSHTACLAEVGEADYLLLIVGSKIGGTYIASEASITNEEYKAAEKLDLPRIVVVQRSVNDYRTTYKKNPRANHSHIVDDTRIFSFIDYIASGHSDNWIHSFETIEDLQKIITTQFAHYLGLFSKSLRKKESQSTVATKALVEFPTSLERVDDRYPDQDEATSFKNGLKSLHDVLKKIITDETKKDAKAEKLKLLWVLARHGEQNGDSLSLLEDRFKQYAWSYYRGQRVNNQFKDYNISVRYRGEADEHEIVLSFEDSNEEQPIEWALHEYVQLLLENHNDADALELFRRADMRIYAQ
jgi:uncharacterized protein DUF4062